MQEATAPIAVSMSTPMLASNIVETKNKSMYNAKKSHDGSQNTIRNDGVVNSYLADTPGMDQFEQLPVAIFETDNYPGKTL